MSSYYDIDQILAEEETLPCIFQVEAINMGYLDTSDNQIDLPRNTHLDLPFWLASPLAKRNYVLIQLPYYFNQTHRYNILADPTSINLYKLCPYFYEFGIMIAQLIDDQDISTTLQKILEVRNRMILDKSQNFLNEEINEITQTLSILEQKLFESHFNSLLHFYRWKNNQTTKYGYHYHHYYIPEIAHPFKKQRIEY